MQHLYCEDSVLPEHGAEIILLCEFLFSDSSVDFCFCSNVCRNTIIQEKYLQQKKK